MAESLTKLLPELMWKIRNMSNELDDLAKETSRKSIVGTTWPFQAA